MISQPVAHPPAASSSLVAHEPSDPSLLPAVMSGSVQAVLFNPVDRALYLRVNHRRRFLDGRNWDHPFQGFANAAVYRTVASGMYLFWQDETTKLFKALAPEAPPHLTSFAVGVAAGSLNGVILNPMQFVKFRMWSGAAEVSFTEACSSLYRIGGAKLFARGASVSIGRDALFGVVYEVLRHSVDIDGDPNSGRYIALRMGSDSCAGMVASMMSSPLNYARNQIYACPPEGCPFTSRRMVAFLAKETMAFPTFRQKFGHLNSRLNVGWGTLRVGIGMAVGQLLFRQAKSRLAVRHNHHQPTLQPRKD